MFTMKLKNIFLSNFKIKFFSSLVKDKDTLDIGIVQHDIANSYDEYWLHSHLRKNSKSIIGVDVDKKNLDILNKRGFNTVYANAENLRLNKSFEIIIAGDLIEHISNAGLFFKSCAKHLHKNGLLGISTPNPFWWKIYFHVLIKGNSNCHDEHTCWYCEKTLSQIANRYNFEPVNIIYGSVFTKITFFQIFSKLINYLLFFLPKKLRHNTFIIVFKKK